MRVLLTGAAGICGTALRPLMSRRYRSLLLTDLVPVDDLRDNEQFVPGDLQDRELADRLLSEVDAMVHLGGLVGPAYSFEQILGPNVVGTYNLFRAASRHGVRQIVYGSSHHAVGFLPRGSRIDSATPPRPDSYYGVSKAIGEVLAAYFADKEGLNVLCLRIGYVGKQVPDERRLHIWCSAEDLAQLIEIGLTRSDLGYRVVYGVSNTPEPFFDNREAHGLGFSPRDCSLEHLADPALATAKVDAELPENRYVGGFFVITDPQGDNPEL